MMFGYKIKAMHIGYVSYVQEMHEMMFGNKLKAIC